MILRKGNTGSSVCGLQYALHMVCCPPGEFDGIFGANTEKAVRLYQNTRGLTVDGIVGDITWGKILLEMADIGQALTAKGYTNGAQGWSAGKAMLQAVLEFQKRHSLSADGMVGPKTMQALDMKQNEEESSGVNSSSGAGGAAAAAGSQNGNTGSRPISQNGIHKTGTTSAVLKPGSNGSLTKYLQQMLNALGYIETADGIFGKNTEAAVLTFQKEHGLEEDSLVGSETWKKLFQVYKIPGLHKSAAGLAAAARYELRLGFTENHSNNITPYGIWYGMNGEPWCAMFVSWCAYQAGILDRIVPRFAYCPYGVHWYREQGRLKAAGGYVPACGDTAFFGSRITGEISHTGIVVSVTGSSVTTIEGNSGDRVRSRNYDMGDPYIYGYGMNWYIE